MQLRKSTDAMEKVTLMDNILEKSLKSGIVTNEKP
jgi:hypothetical protein